MIQSRGRVLFPETIETDTLRLTCLAPGTVDVFDLYECFAEEAEGSSEVFAYIPQEPFSMPKGARDFLEGAAEQWEASEHAKYGVYEADDALAGVAALSPEWDRRLATIAVILARRVWRQGYASECAMALTELAFDRLDLELVALEYDEGNERSKAAIEAFVDRLGGQYDGVRRNTTPRDDEIADSFRYTVTREQYQRFVPDS